MNKSVYTVFETEYYVVKYVHDKYTYLIEINIYIN